MTEPRPIYTTHALTAAQQNVLDAIALYTANHPYPPTLADIAWLAGLESRSTVLFHVRALEALGLIQRDAKIARSIRIVAK